MFTTMLPVFAVTWAKYSVGAKALKTDIDFYSMLDKNVGISHDVRLFLQASGAGPKWAEVKQVINLYPLVFLQEVKL